MLISFVSAKGAPGVTTVVSAIGGVWNSDVVVADLDPAGSDFALRHRKVNGEPVDPDRGLLSMAAAARRGMLSPGEVHEHTQELDGGMEILSGVTRPEQIAGIGSVWPTIGNTLRDMSADVLADCGRTAPGTPVMPVLSASDAVIFVVRPTVEDYAHLRERLRWLVEPLRIGQAGAVPVGIVLVAPSKESNVGRDLDRLLQSEQLQVSVLGRIAMDPKAADTIAGRTVRRIDRSLLVRSAREVAGSIRAMAAARPNAAARAANQG